MKKRILIVDDCKNFLKGFSLIFTHLGYEADTAEHGIEALERMKKTHYDGMTLGIIMPYMGGLETLQRVRETNQTIPIFIISGGYWSLSEDELRYLLANANNLIVKPFTIEELQIVLGRCFGSPDKPSTPPTSSAVSQ